MTDFKLSNKVLIPLLLLIAAVYGFSQSVRIPLDSHTAVKVLAARDMLSGEGTGSPLTGIHPLEIPVYLLCVRVLGFGTFAASAAADCFFILIFCAGLWILSSRGLLSPLTGLIWLAAAGMPDSYLLQCIRDVPVLTFALLLLPCFFARFIETRKAGYASGAVISLVLFLSALRLPQKEIGWSLLRSFLKVFRADFSGQPLLAVDTGRYFLNTLTLLILLYILIRVIMGSYRGDPFIPVYGAAILLTLCSGFLPLPNGAGSLLFTWLPFGAALLLISAWKSSGLHRTRFMGNRLSLSAAAFLFFAAAAVLNFGPIVTSRPPGPADRIAALFEERELTSGYCSPEDYALFSTASKGGLQLTSDPADPANRFCILREDSPETCGTGETFEIDFYRVVILP